MAKKLMDTDNSLVITREKGVAGREVKEGKGRINGARKRLNLRW